VPGRRALPDAGPTMTHPGIYAALSNSALESAQKIDPRILCAMYDSGGSMTMAEAQEMSDRQPHSVSLRALADQVDRRERVSVQPWRVIDLITGKDGSGMGDLEHEGIPVWLAELVRQPPPDVGPRLAVTVAPDDSVRPAPVSTVPAW
jgi:hypothetical protein